MLTGGIALQRELQVPAALIVALNGVVVVFVVGSLKLRDAAPRDGPTVDERLEAAVVSDFFTVSVIVATLASGIRLATPFLLAALGETIGQRSGVLNLGVEGVMLIGAFAAYYTDAADRQRRRSACSSRSASDA